MKVQSRLRGKGYFVEKQMNAKGGTYRNRTCLFLTNEGISVWLLSLDPSNPVKSIAKKRKITTRNGVSGEEMRRIIRMADAGCFLSSSGVVSPYAAVTTLGENPFVFGLSAELPKSKQEAVLRDAITDALVTYIKSQEKSDIPLQQMCDTTSFDGYLYLRNVKEILARWRY